MNKENWKPKVGEPCLWLSSNTGVYHHTKIIHIFEESAWLEGEGVVAHEPNRYKPLKTSAEVERESTVNAMLEINGYPSGYEGDMSKYMNKLYDEGYRKQQVKPLSYEEFKNIVETRVNLKFVWNYLSSTSYIIRGGDE